MATKYKEDIKKYKSKKNKKNILILGIFIMCIGAFALLKTELFNISQVVVKNNNILSVNDIVDKEELIGNNMFLVKLKELEDKILLNPYVEKVSIKRKIFNKIVIQVEERVASYKVVENDKTYILNDNLVIMEKRDEIKGINLPILEGVDVTGRELGEEITENKEKINFLKELKNILNNNSDIRASSVDVSDIDNVSVYLNDCKVIIGNGEKIENKLIKAINILKSDKVNIENGYINVSFNGNAVIYEGGDSSN